MINSIDLHGNGYTVMWEFTPGGLVEVDGDLCGHMHSDTTYAVLYGFIPYGGDEEQVGVGDDDDMCVCWCHRWQS